MERKHKSTDIPTTGRARVQPEAGRMALEYLFTIRDRCKEYAEYADGQGDDDMATAFRECAEWLDDAQEDCARL